MEINLNNEDPTDLKQTGNAHICNTEPSLNSMVLAYRVTELQALLGFAGKNKTGRKNELQSRALELVKAKSPPVVMKIRELYRSIQISNYSHPLTNPTLGSSMSMTTRGSSSSSYYTSETKVATPENTSFGRSVGYQRVIGGDGRYTTVPICPDIKMKELPFYDIMATLLRPTSLLNQGSSPKQEAQHSFCLSPSQAAEITNSRELLPSEMGIAPKIQYLVQVQLRFCALDPNEEQDDLFPQGLIVKVNGRPVTLPTPIPSNRPGVEPKRPSKPLNITTNVKCCPLSSNVIIVQWIADPQRNYCMLINMVKKLTADTLFQRLKTKRIQPADFTRGRIKEITTAEEEDLCAPTSIRVSVACPLGKSRMSYPCRATTCKHLQCFDANLFLLMNERKPTFVCPVCNKQLKFGDLCIDGYFMDVIKNLSIDAGNEIELSADGSWLPALKVKQEADDCGPPAKKLKSEPVKANKTIDLDDDIAILSDDDDDDSKPEQVSAPTVSSTSKGEPEVIDLLDSSDEEEEPTSKAVGQTHADEDTRQTIQSESGQETVQQQEEESEEEIGIRPRRKNKKISYVEDSSSDSSSAAPASSSRRPRSPAFIDLEDDSSPSPSPANSSGQRRNFAGIGTGQSSGTGSSNNNRSGSGYSTSTPSLYSSSGTISSTPRTTAVVAPTLGDIGSSSAYTQYPHFPPHPFYASTSYSLSASASTSSAGVQQSLTSSIFFPPGYAAGGSAASSTSAWDDADNLASIINQPSTFMNYLTSGGTPAENQSTYSIDEFLNIGASHEPSSSSPYPFSGGAGFSGWGM